MKRVVVNKRVVCVGNRSQKRPNPRNTELEMRHRINQLV